MTENEKELVEELGSSLTTQEWRSCREVIQDTEENLAEKEYIKKDDQQRAGSAKSHVDLVLRFDGIYQI